MQSYKLSGTPSLAGGFRLTKNGTTQVVPFCLWKTVKFTGQQPPLMLQPYRSFPK